MTDEDLTDNERAALAELVDAAQFASKPRTLKEIGDRIGRSRERTRQMQTIALAKIRRALEQEAPTADARGAWLDGDDEGSAAHGLVRGASPWL